MAAVNPRFDLVAAGANSYISRAGAVQVDGDGQYYLDVSTRMLTSGLLGTEEQMVEFIVPLNLIQRIDKMILKYTVTSSGSVVAQIPVPVCYHLNRTDIEINDKFAERLLPESQHLRMSLDKDFITQCATYFGMTNYGTSADTIGASGSRTYYLPTYSHLLVDSNINLTLVHPSTLVKIKYYFTTFTNFLSTTAGSSGNATVSDMKLWFICRNYGDANIEFRKMFQGRRIVYPMLEERRQIVSSVAFVTGTESMQTITNAEGTRAALLLFGVRAAGATRKNRYTYVRSTKVTLYDNAGRTPRGVQVPIPIFLIDLYNKFNDSYFFYYINLQGYSFANDPVATLSTGVHTGSAYIGNNWKLGLEHSASATADLVILSWHHQFCAINGLGQLGVLRVA